MAGVKFKIEVSGLAERLQPLLKNFVGTDRIQRMRVGMSKASNRMKYYVKQVFVKFQKSGLLSNNIAYRVKYFRNTDTIVGVIGVRSKKEFMYKGRNQVTHMYAHFLTGGRKIANQMLKQPYFAKRTTDPNAKPRWPRKPGPQPPYINLQAIIDAHKEEILRAAVRGVIKMGK